MESDKYKPKRVTNNTGMVTVIPILKYVPHLILIPFWSKINELEIIATKDRVAFQMIPVTVPTLANSPKPMLLENQNRPNYWQD